MLRFPSLWLYGLFALWWGGSDGIAQRTSIRFERLGARHGISQVNVIFLLQDRQGFVWASTEDGLNRYDGYRFEVFRHNVDDPTSLPENYVWCMLEDKEGQIWLGTNTGLCRYDPTQETFTKIQLTGPSQTIRVSALSLDHSGRLWIGTHEGILIMNTSEEKAVPLEGPYPNEVAVRDIQAMILGKNNQMWVGTVNGLFAYDLLTKKWTPFQVNPEDPKSLSHADVRALCITSKGELWVGTLSGLNRLNADGSFTRFFHDPTNPHSIGDNFIRSLFEDSTGTFWVGTRKSLDRQGTQGFEHFRHDPTNPYSLGDSTIISMMEDQGGNLWFGTDIAGISIHKKRTNKFTNVTRDSSPTSLSYPSVRAFLLDSEEILWIGTPQGLNRYHQDLQGFTHLHPEPENPNSLIDDRVSCLAEGPDGGIWIGTFGGLSRFNKKTNQFSNYANDPDNPASLSHNLVRALYLDSRKVLWVGTHAGGLNQYVPEKDGFEHYRHDPKQPGSISNDYVRAFLEDSHGRFWIGTGLGGLCLMDRDTKKFTQYRHRENDPTSLSHDSVKVIVEDAHGRLWLGTHGGLNLFDPISGRFRNWREKHGLPNDSVYGILLDTAGNLWMSTNMGLSQFNPETEIFRNFDVRHGLQSNEFNAGAYYKDRHGRLYFGGIEGYNTFLPQGFDESHYHPPLVLTDFLIANKTVPLIRTHPNSPLKENINFTKAITLDHTRNMFSFEFSSLDYTVPEKNRYAYILEGYDAQWIETQANNRRATYTNLPSGNYRFRVKGSNHDGVWSPNEAAVSLTIKPPPWRTVWAWILYIAIVGMVIWSYLHQQRLKLINERKIASQQRQLAEQERELASRLERMVERRTAELEERNRELETMDRVVQVINRETRVDKILMTILSEALLLAPNAEKGTFVLRHRYGKKLNVVASYGYESQDLGALKLDIDFLATRYRSGEEGPVNGIYRLEPGPDMPFNQELGPLADALSVVALEVSLDGRLEGYLVLDNMTRRKAFTDNDARKLARFRDHAVITLGKARALEDLLEAQRELMTAAHEAGMAEIATEVLHNVGNLLNSVKTSGHLLQEAVAYDGFMIPFVKAKTFLESGQEINPEKREVLTKCLQKCSDLFSKQQAIVAAESERMNSGLNAIFGLLSEQRRLTHPRRTLQEAIDLNQIVEETAQGCFTREQRLFVKSNLGILPPIRVEVLKLRRVVFFMLDNALNSISAKELEQPLIQVTTTHDGENLCLSVTDNGQSLKDVDLQEVFGQKLDGTDKNRWYGLHYCANTVKEMNGRIEAVPIDSNRQRVTVWIPLRPSGSTDQAESLT